MTSETPCLPGCRLRRRPILTHAPNCPNAKPAEPRKRVMIVGSGISAAIAAVMADNFVRDGLKVAKPAEPPACMPGCRPVYSVRIMSGPIQGDQIDHWPNCPNTPKVAAEPPACVKCGSRLMGTDFGAKGIGWSCDEGCTEILPEPQSEANPVHGMTPPMRTNDDLRRYNVTQSEPPQVDGGYDPERHDPVLVAIRLDAENIALKAERDALKAKVDRLVSRGIEDLRHENAELLATIQQRNGAHDALMDENAAIKARVERYEDLLAGYVEANIAAQKAEAAGSGYETRSLALDFLKAEKAVAQEGRAILARRQEASNGK